MRLAIVPARAGSKRIPNKNIRDFCGKPMLSYPLEAARASGLFETVHVSTDSPDICEIAKSLGFPVPFLRDASLADDRTPLMPVVKWVLEKYREEKKTFSDVCLLMPCSPLLTPEDLTVSFGIYEANGRRNPLLSVAQYPAPVEWAFEREKSGRLRPCQPGMFAKRSQDLGQKFYDTGSIGIFNVDQVLNEEHSDGNFVSYVVPKHRAVDIDDEDDWLRAQALYRAMTHNG